MVSSQEVYSFPIQSEMNPEFETAIHIYAAQREHYSSLHQIGEASETQSSQFVIKKPTLTEFVQGLKSQSPSNYQDILNPKPVEKETLCGVPKPSKCILL